jgi:hypothetical protein
MTTEPNAKRWFFITMIDSMPHVGFISLIFTLWAIWFARRKAIHDDEFQSLMFSN